MYKNKKTALYIENSHNQARALRQMLRNVKKRIKPRYSAAQQQTMSNHEAFGGK